MDKRAEYTIGIKSEGLSNLTKVIEELDKAGVETSEFKREAALLRQQLAEMQQQQQLIDSFAKIKQETTGAAAAFEAAQQKAQQLGREMAAIEAPTKKQVTDFARAREAVNSAKDAYQAAQLRLQSMRGTLAENGIETAGLAQKQALLRNGVRDVETAVAAATSRLKELGASAPKAINDVAAATDRAAASTKSYQGTLTPVAQAIAGVFAVSQVTSHAIAINEVADQYKNLEARVRLAVGEQVNLQTAVVGIARVAKDTYSNLDATAELFGRLAASGKELNITNAEALGITKTINQSIQVSGASAQASEASVRQLVQALQSGTLRGDEFNSIMEQAPRLAKALADGLQVPIGALRGMAEQGELTSARVVKALKGQAEAINAEFASLPLTTGRALENLRTQWTLFIGSLDASTGVSSTVAAGINALAANLETVARVAGLAGAALTASLAVQGVAALRAYAAEAALAAGATNLLAASINKVPKAVNIAVGVTGFELGMWVGEKLRENSELARKFGVGLVGYFAVLVNGLRLAKEAAAAVFTSDTVDAAYARFEQRNTQVRESIQAMMVDAKDAPSKVAEAANQSGAALQGMGQAGQQAGQSIASGAAAGSAGLTALKNDANDALTIFKALQGEAQRPAQKQNAVTEIIEQLVEAKKKGLDLDALFRKELPEALSKLSGTDLAKFREEFTRSMQLAGATGKELQTGLRLIGEQAAKSLGVDVRVASNQLSEGFKKADEDMRMLILSMPALKAAGIDTGRAVGEALANMLDGAKSLAEVDSVRQRIQALRKDLGDKVADGLLDQAKDKANELKDALDKALPGINSVREAMKQLGITSDADLKKVADSAREAYNTLATSGTASARELSEGFKKAAEAAIAANNGVAPSWVTAAASLRGFTVEVDNAGKSTLRLKDATNSATDAQGRANRATRDATTELERLNAVREREIAAQEKANQLKEREMELYQKKWNMDSQHRSLDAEGKVREETGIPTRKGIYDRAKTAGLSEEEAIALADSFDINKLKDTGSRGTPFVNLQPLDDAISNAVLEAARRKAGGSGQSTTPTPEAAGGRSAVPSTAAPSSSSGGGMQAPTQSAPTFISQVNIVGVGSATFRFPDAQSQQGGEDLLRKLAQAKGASI